MSEIIEFVVYIWHNNNSEDRKRLENLLVLLLLLLSQYHWHQRTTFGGEVEHQNIPVSWQNTYNDDEQNVILMFPCL